MAVRSVANVLHMSIEQCSATCKNTCDHVDVSKTPNVYTDCSTSHACKLVGLEFHYRGVTNGYMQSDEFHNFVSDTGTVIEELQQAFSRYQKVRDERIAKAAHYGEWWNEAVCRPYKDEL